MILQRMRPPKQLLLLKTIRMKSDNGLPLCLQRNVPLQLDSKMMVPRWGLSWPRLRASCHRAALQNQTTTTATTVVGVKLTRSPATNNLPPLLLCPQNGRQTDVISTVSKYSREHSKVYVALHVFNGRKNRINHLQCKFTAFGFVAARSPLWIFCLLVL